MSKIKFLMVLWSTVVLGQMSASAGPNDSDWIQLFNKADTSLRTNWDVHILGSALNVDTRNTFRWRVVGADTTLEVNYDNYTSWSGNPWGHIGYKARSWNYYIVRVEHQFFGTQATGASASNAWANQNNGIMHHSQSVASMGVNQDYPISLEAQLLGPANTGADNNSTLNLCTPGTGFYTTATGTSGKQTGHCYSAIDHDRSAALAPKWAKATVVALSDSIIRYYYQDTLVYTFYRPIQYAGAVSGNTVPIVNDTPIKGGYIVLQGESAPTRFRKVELLNLEGCMTVGNANYKSYFVHSDPTACATTGISFSRQKAAGIFSLVADKIVANDEILKVEIFNWRGIQVSSFPGHGQKYQELSGLKPGVYAIRVQTHKGSAQILHTQM